jgi:hypothetical protein
MALQMAYNLESGISLPFAYFKIIYAEANFVISKLRLSLAVYKDESSRTAEKPEVITITFEASGTNYNTFFSEEILATKSFLTASYDYLKSLPFFSEAISL